MGQDTVPDSSVGKESACNSGDPILILGQEDLPGEGTGYPLQYSQASLVAQLVRICHAGDLGLIPGVGRSPGEGKGYPLQYSGLENSMDSIRPWSHKELEMTERLSFTYICIEIWTYDLKHLDKNT